MKVKWNVDNGYVNNIPDWEFTVDPEEFSYLNDNEIEEALMEMVEEEFRSHVSPYLTNFDEVIKYIKRTR